MRKCSDMPYHIGIVLKLYPSDKQKHLIAVNDGAQRSVYNFLVAAGNDLYRMKKAAACVPAYREHMAYLEATAFSAAGVKAALPYLSGRDIDCQTVENGIRNYHAAWKNMRENHRGVPVFHKKSYEQSYQTNCHYSKLKTAVTDGTIRFDGTKHILLPKLGRTKCAGSPDMTAVLFRHPEDTRIGTVTISRDAAGEYWCSLAVSSEYPFRDPLPKTGRQAGIDLNILNLADGSDGVSFDNRRFARQSADKLAKCQHRLSRMAVRAKAEGRSLQSGSNYQKQRVRTARINICVFRQRSDYLNRVSRTLVENQDLIAMENLRVKNLVRNHKLAYSIADCGWRRLITLTQQKASLYGKEVILVPPKYTTQTCSACGHVMKGKESLTLQDRDWVCPVCGTHHLRDINAGKVILQRALKMKSSHPAE